MMKMQEKHLKRMISCHLLFMTAACAGAFFWQMCLPRLAEDLSFWGSAPGWQREIALWNVGIIAALLAALIRQELASMKLMLLQSTVLCWLLGAHHCLALSGGGSSRSLIHILGTWEVMLLGGVWGAALLLRIRRAGGR